MENRYAARKDNPFGDCRQPSPEDIKKALGDLIMSASGWRKVFAADGDENSLSPGLACPDLFLTAGMGHAFAGYLKAVSGKSRPRAALGTDTRRTGPLMADIIARSLLSLGCEVLFLSALPAPEIMAFVRNEENIDGFLYISASHNPPGHNGVKFGLNRGSVLSGTEIGPLIESYKKLAEAADFCRMMTEETSACGLEKLAAMYAAGAGWKEKSEKHYTGFLKTVITAAKDDGQAEKLWRRMAAGADRRPLGILADFNGSARIRSVDKTLLTGLGVQFASINAEPGVFAHAIIPEGASLEICKKALEKTYAGNRAYLAGYVPDCDGDRGNFVYMDEASGKAVSLEAQEVFALSAALELAYLAFLTSEGLHKTPHMPPALAANDPTSLRIEAIARAFGAEVFRAEVGEANVVNLARELRAGGREVRVLGEGSNGGTIIHPSAVRDPLTSLGALLKFFLLTSDKTGKSLKTLVMEILAPGDGRMTRSGGYDVTLADLVAVLPAYVTTRVEDPKARMTIKTGDHAGLKAEFEEIFLKEWEKRKDYLKDSFGIWNYREINYEGTRAVEGFGPAYRTGRQRGGLKIQFGGRSGKPLGFIWMRGSGTEPVFRLLADIEGTEGWKEDYLITWLKDMLVKADEKASVSRRVLP